jgi:hypothetical protein
VHRGLQLQQQVTGSFPPALHEQQMLALGDEIELKGTR